jgi:excisionase family DNA binding protein
MTQSPIPVRTQAGPDDLLRELDHCLIEVEGGLANARVLQAALEAEVHRIPTTTLDPELYTTDQIAILIGASRSTAAKMIAQKIIPSVLTGPTGTSRRVRRADFKAYLDSLVVAS